MPRTTLRSKGQLTLPEAEITSDGIFLRPQKVIDSTQAWFTFAGMASRRT